MSSNSILFRVDGNDQIGLGHLKRCWEVIKSLKLMNFEVYIVCQTRSLKFANLIIKGIELISISNDLDIEEDASETVSIAKTRLVDLIFLDSYILDVRWEETVKKERINLIAFDDRCIVHKADLVINYRPNIHGREAQKDHPKQEWLLGSNFIPLHKDSIKSDDIRRRVLIHAGGASLYHQNMRFFSKCVVEIARLKIHSSIICSTPDSHLLVDQIINSNELDKNLFHKIDFIPNLAEHLSSYQWVIGPAGTILYEALLAGCTCISYSNEDQSDNQTDSWLNLGHTFHLDDRDMSDECDASDLIHLALSSADIDTRLKRTAPCSIDGLGPQRISEAIIQLSRNKSIARTHLRELSDIVKANSSVIWPWLRARNSRAVRGYSSNQHTIKKAQHLKWWVNLSREKYVLQRDGLYKAYFWHEKKVDTEGTFFIGGWFPAFNQSMNLLDAIEIITFQIQEAKKVCKRAVWLANIDPNNKISQSISQYFGFKTADKINRNRLRKCFPNMTEQMICLEREVNDASEN